MTNLDVIKEKCPYCDKDTVKVEVYSRVNYSHGKRGGAELRKKEIIKTCLNEKKNKGGIVTWKCDYKDNQKYK